MTNQAEGRLAVGLGIGLSLLLLSSTSMVAAGTPAPTGEISFKLVPGGCFMMGAEQLAPMSRQGQPMGPRADELPQHEVCVDAFELATHEVTQAQWWQVMGGAINPDQALHPKAYVRWEDAQHFIEQLNKTSAALRYRLPTEAEWEYACRAGGTANDNAQLDSPEHLEQLKTMAWFNEPFRTEAQARPVGEMPPNAWGFHDMLGNVWEWTADEYQADAYQQHPKSNPHLVRGGERRVIRGASYTSNRFLVRCGSRNYALPNDPLPTQGLRLVRQAGTN